MTKDEILKILERARNEARDTYWNLWIVHCSRFWLRHFPGLSGLGHNSGRFVCVQGC